MSTDFFEALLKSPGAVGRFCAYLTIAENEIERAKAQHPEHAAKLDAAFGALVPPDEFAGLNYQALYTAHCRELLERVAGKMPISLELATDAEMLVPVMQASLRAPLSEFGHGIYATLFNRVMAGTAAQEQVPAEPWPGAYAEELAAMRRKQQVKGRGKLNEN